jgi:Tfp pilus assembly protein PilN
MIERIEINLLPAEYRFHRRTIRIQREIIYPALIVIIIFVSLILWNLFQMNTISTYNSQISYLEQQINLNRPIQNEINKLRADKLTIQEKIRALERINVNREKWVKLMEELSGRLPEYTWLVSVKEENSTPPVLSIEGRTFSFPDVANYMSNLKESVYVSGVDLTNIEQIDSKENLFKFFITCSINPDVNLPAVTDQPLDAKIVKGGKR